MLEKNIHYKCLYLILPWPFNYLTWYLYRVNPFKFKSSASCCALCIHVIVNFPCVQDLVFLPGLREIICIGLTGQGREFDKIKRETNNFWKDCVILLIIPSPYSDVTLKDFLQLYGSPVHSSILPIIFPWIIYFTLLLKKTFFPGSCSVTIGPRLHDTGTARWRYQIE